MDGGAAFCSGHCPHHEVPKAVDWAMLTWMGSAGQEAPVHEGETVVMTESDGRSVKIVGRDGRPNSAPTNTISKVVEALEKVIKKSRKEVVNEVVNEVVK